MVILDSNNKWLFFQVVKAAQREDFKSFKLYDEFSWFLPFSYNL